MYFHCKTAGTTLRVVGLSHEDVSRPRAALSPMEHQVELLCQLKTSNTCLDGGDHHSLGMQPNRDLHNIHRLAGGPPTAGHFQTSKEILQDTKSVFLGMYCESRDLGCP